MRGAANPRVLAFAVLAGLVVALYVLWGGGREEQSSRSFVAPATSTAKDDASYEPDTAAAWSSCQGFVRDALKLESEGTFSPGTGDAVTYLGSRRYKAVGWIETENDSGAKVKTDFVCTVRDELTAGWRLEEARYTGHAG